MGKTPLTIPEQLPFWPADLVGLPWATIRSALFAPVRKGSRAALQRERIATVGDIEIIYTGLQLDQADLDVFASVLQIARSQPLGQSVHFKTREMLRILGRNEGKGNREWLLRSLSRLEANSIEIYHSTKGVAYTGRLIEQQARDELAGMHYVVLSPRLRGLYTSQGWQAINWENRQKLGRNQLAKWLHGFVAGQNRPLTFGIERLMALANANYSRPRDFREAMQDAADALRGIGVEVTLAWEVDRGLVTISVTTGKPNSKLPSKAPSEGA